MIMPAPEAMPVQTTSPLEVYNPGLSGGIDNAVTAVGIVAVPVPAVALAGRVAIEIQNVGDTVIYYGKATVTADVAATGGPYLLPGQSKVIGLSDATILYCISTVAGGFVATLEVAA